MVFRQLGTLARRLLPGQSMRPYLALVIAACSIGCTQHIYRAPRPSEVGGSVVVTTREGQVIRASRASVSEGTIEVPYARQRRRLDLTSVEHIETRARTRGLIFGALGGAAVGFGVAAGALNESGDLDPGSQDNQQVATTLLIGTAVGAGLGAILGWELLGRNVYHPQAANPLLSAPGSAP